MPTGKRQHKPVSITKPIDKASPRAAGKDTTAMREQARTKDSIEPPKPPGGD
jgi:type VI protein secretion system component Hcp